jgi:hypothetical protein
MVSEHDAMTSDPGQRGGVTRREAMARALKAGAYAAPVVLSASALAGRVGAATPPPGPAIACGTTGLAFIQDALLLGVFPGTAFDVYAQPNTVATAAKVGSFTADAEGVAAAVFALPLVGGAQIPFGTTSVTVSVNLAGSAATVASFVSPIAGALACTTAGTTLPVAGLTPQLLAKVVQEQTGCPGGVAGAWKELVDVNVVNIVPNASYDVYIRPNNGTTGGFVPAGTLTTNAQGNAGAVLSVVAATTGAAPTGVTVNVVPAGMPATAAGALTFAAGPTGNPTTSSLFTVACTGTITSQTVSTPLLIGVR